MSGATKILMGSGGVDLPSDDEFDRTSFLSHFDGSNNGTNIVYDDSSASNHTVSLTGTPSQGTFGPFSRAEGEWSNYFEGTNDVIYLDGSGSEFAFGTDPFTIEGWVWPEGAAGAGSATYVLAGGAMLTIYTYQNNTIHFVISLSNAAAASANVISVNTTNLRNQWSHFAVTRSGSNLSAFYNGTRIGTVSNASGTFLALAGDAPLTNIHIGAYAPDGSYDFDGYISNIRIVKGTAVYDPTSSSCTVPTSALTAISGTSLLTCQSNRVKDNSASAHAITIGGSPKASAFTPILTSEVYDPAVNGASAFFVGSGTATEIKVDASGSDFAFGTGEFTLEGWYYRESTSASYAAMFGMGVLMQFYFNNTTPQSILWYITTNESSVVLNSMSTLGNELNQWNHWAVSRSGSNLSVFINGVRALTTSSAGGTFTACTNVSYPNLINGGYLGNTTHYPLGGYISDVRVVKGTAVYDPTSSTCTVPTAPLTAITNTKLLLNMADGQALDSAAQNNMTLRNVAVTSTTQEKFGTASLDLTASDAFVTFPASTNDFGSGNFTIEAWVYVEDVSAYNCIISYGDPIQFYVKGGTLECYAKPLTGSGNFLGPSSSISNDTWCHVAMVRNGTSLTAYVNGVGGTPVTFSDAALTAYTGTASIGVYNNAAGTTLSFDGYIDDLRISHVARYTSNFTPTTEAFPDKGQ